MEDKISTEWIIAIASAVIGSVFMPFFLFLKGRLKSSYDDRQSLIGKWSCKWYSKINGQEDLYTTDQVEVISIKSSRFSAIGTDKRFRYKLEGYISRGNVISFYYIILNKNQSLTGSGTLKMNPSGSILQGEWFGYLSEDILNGGKVIWERISEN